MTTVRLAPGMSVAQFDRGYWYATELRRFAVTIGVPNVSRLRKDGLERAIKAFLRTGKVSSRTPRAPTTGRDTDRPLRLDRRVVAYINNAETKEFLEREARRMEPSYRRRSGARYRINRWRDEQLERGVAITYRDLVREYVRLSVAEVKYKRVPTGRYINFMTDFLAREKGATHARAIAAWHQLKAMDVPKTYAAWASTRARRG